MLRWPVKLVLICAGIVAVVLGAHGLYTYFKCSSIENQLTLGFMFALSDTDPEWYFSRLFLSVDVPSQFQSTILWASSRGLESWFIPGCLVGAGLFLWYVASGIYIGRLRLPRPIEKLRSKLW